MQCEEMLKMLNEYVDGELDPSICEQLQEHLAECDPCRVVVDTIRKTITLYRDGSHYELPVQFREKLHENLRARWKDRSDE
jgi:anti-sigma factor (TIGR02949 family)